MRLDVQVATKSWKAFWFLLKGENFIFKILLNKLKSLRGMIKCMVKKYSSENSVIKIMKGEEHVG